MKDYILFDKVPSREWEESVPIGNGRMGATMMCGVSYENIFLNEETIWSSHNVGEPNPEMYAILEFPATQKELVFIDRNGKCHTVQNNRLTIQLDGECSLKIKK